MAPKLAIGSGVPGRPTASARFPGRGSSGPHGRRGQSGVRDAQHGQVAGRVAPDEPRGVLPAVGCGDGQIGIAFEHVRCGHHLVATPGETARWKSAAAVDRDDRARRPLDGRGQVVGQAGEDAAASRRVFESVMLQV